MNTALDVLLLVSTLVVGVWVVLFGPAGAMLNRRGGGSAAAGFAIGVLFGPFGLAWLALRSRHRTATVPEVTPPPPPPQHVGTAEDNP